MMTTVNRGNNPLVSLHRYFIWANRMKNHFDAVLARSVGDPTKVDPIESNLYMSYWYGGIYVVIEGWKELGLTDPTIDPYLSSPNVDLLRRYRNGVFHFQKEYYDDRFLRFMVEGEDAVAWVRGIHEAFSNYLLREIQKTRIST